MLRSSGNIGPGLGLGSELSTLISPESNRASTGYFVLELNINGTWMSWWHLPIQGGCGTRREANWLTLVVLQPLESLGGQGKVSGPLPHDFRRVVRAWVQVHLRESGWNLWKFLSDCLCFLMI